MLAHRSRSLSLAGIMALLAILFGAIFVACGDDDADEPEPTPTQTAASPAATSPTTTPSPTPTEEPIEGEILVFAASSLTDAFTEAGEAFQAKNPKAKVTFNFAASSALATQINEGAPADVFASADSAQMRAVTEKGNAADPVIFVTNKPTIVVPKSGSPVEAFADLTKSGVRLVLAGPEVPIGRYAREILTNASKPGAGVSEDFSDKVLENLKSNEANVRAVLAKVQLGEADAGIVYTTDAAIATDEVRLIEIPEQYNVVAQYPMAAVKEAKNSAGAKAWVDFILGTDGQALMAKYGFGKPPAEATTATGTVTIEGAVDKQVSITADQVKAMPQKTVKATDSKGVENSYTGASLASVLALAGVKSSATQVTFTGADGYAKTVAVADLKNDPDAVLIVEESNGFLRNIIPSQPPGTWVKALAKIVVE
jgi:molybdate transport system substrate-binding protein